MVPVSTNSTALLLKKLQAGGGEGGCGCGKYHDIAPVAIVEGDDDDDDGVYDYAPAA